MHNLNIPPIQFHFLATVSFSQRTLVKEVIRDLFRKEKTKLEQLRYIFCSDEYLLEINKQHLQHNYFTDIITFDLSEKPNAVIGEIYISVDRVKDNAQTYKVPVKQELLRVIFHGALHLCGYKDKTKKEEELMRKAEDKYLQYYSSKANN
ncbi:rRNA maturation RNase YbeY [Longitalea arenae]|uniref:rRNA maturation RNase YbeY n=1 Tax=Longitalea arenae TaxID=2812558 RepID=UPI00196807EC|nr:rRNA maturation RNase YbeY [Longitalea arenae]